MSALDPSAGVRGWNHCMVHTGAFCHPKTEDEVKNFLKSSVLPFCNRGMEKMFVFVILSTMGINDLLRAERLQAWVRNSNQHLSSLVPPLGTRACASRSSGKLGSVGTPQPACPRVHSVASTHWFINLFIHLSDLIKCSLPDTVLGSWRYTKTDDGTSILGGVKGDR